MKPLQRRVSNAGLSALLLLASATAQAGVIAHWTLDGTPGTVPTGAGSVADTSGNGLNGTPEGTPTYTNDGLRFDGAGSSDGVFLADSSLFSSPSLTVEAFVSLDSLPTSPSELRQIVFRGDSRAGFDPFYLGVLGNKIRWYVQGSSSAAAVDVAIPFALDELFHVAGTIDDSTGLMSLYFNGTLVGSRTTAERPTLPVFNARVSIGYLFDGGGRGQYLDGVIGDLRISDTALAPDQFLNAAPVPEPSTLLLGLLGLPLLMRRRR